MLAQGGLSKLAEAETTVDELSSEAQKQREALTAKQTEVDESMEAIEAAMEAASSRRAEVEQLSAQQEKASQAAVQRKVCMLLLQLHLMHAQYDHCKAS